MGLDRITRIRQDTAHEEWSQDLAEIMRKHRGWGLTARISEFGEVSPPTWRWIGVAQEILKARALVRPRADLLDVWAKQPARPRLGRSALRTLLNTTLSVHAVTCLPVLIGMGAATPGVVDDKIRKLLAHETKAGRWPFLDQLMPDITSDFMSRSSLIDGLFSQQSRNRPSFVANVLKLESNPDMVRALSRYVVRLADQHSRLPPEESRKVAAIIKSLGIAGWLDPAAMAEEVSRWPNANAAHACIASVEEVQMRSRTSPARENKATPVRLRL